MNQPTTYSIPEGLLQAIVSNLNGQPAGQSRVLLNAIEAECQAQERARMESAQAEQREAIRAELKAELDQKLDDAVHTSAPPPLPELVDQHLQTR